MAKINLLPWRQEVREQKNREFLTLVIAVLFLSLLGAFAGWSYYKNILENQQLANERIKQENTNLDKALKEIESLEQQRDDIIARMKVIQDLQGRRPVPVRIWDDIARIIPAQMYLTNMKREGDVITFTGQADNPNIILKWVPDETCHSKLEQDIHIEYSWSIKRDECDVPDFIYERFMSQITDGALAILYSIPSQEFTNLQYAAALRANLDVQYRRIKGQYRRRDAGPLKMRLQAPTKASRSFWRM